MKVYRVVSGGQTGADRGALEAAQLDLGWKPGERVGGYVPRGRRAEDGRVPDCFQMEETPEPAYHNVVFSDATVLFYHGAKTPGVRLTHRMCREADRPCRVFDLQVGHIATTVNAVEAWVRSLEKEAGTLNVAGTRESEAPGVQAAVREIMGAVLGRLGYEHAPPADEWLRAQGFETTDSGVGRVFVRVAPDDLLSETARLVRLFAEHGLEEPVIEATYRPTDGVALIGLFFRRPASG